MIPVSILEKISNSRHEFELEFVLTPSSISIEIYKNYFSATFRHKFFSKVSRKTNPIAM